MASTPENSFNSHHIINWQVLSECAWVFGDPLGRCGYKYFIRHKHF